jgi:hypothetical protein
MDVAQKQGQVDHLWIRVADVAAARAEHESAFERAGWALRTETPERVGFGHAETSLSFVLGEPTRNVRVDLGGGAGLTL